MRTIIAIALATTTLVAGALPATAFDTPNFANKAVAWQERNERIAQHMRSAPAGVRKLIDGTEPYVEFLERISANVTTCQADAGFALHRSHVLKYAIALTDSSRAMDKGHWSASHRFAKAAISHYRAADTFGARVIDRCW